MSLRIRPHAARVRLAVRLATYRRLGACEASVQRAGSWMRMGPADDDDPFSQRREFDES
jgi:hypothetical protein